MRTPGHRSEATGRSTETLPILASIRVSCKVSDLERMRDRARRQHERALASGDVEVESIFAALVEELRR